MCPEQPGVWSVVSAAEEKTGVSEENKISGVRSGLGVNFVTHGLVSSLTETDLCCHSETDRFIFFGKSEWYLQEP